MKLSARRTEDPEINLISLIDVLLMMVIFFMVSSSFVGEGRLRVQLPEASTARSSSSPSDALVIAVTEQGAYRVNDRELINSSRETLQAAIVKVAGADRSGRVMLRADARATHQSVVTAMDVLGRLGFAEINIATVDLQKPPPAPAARAQP